MSEDSKERLNQWDGTRFPTQYENAHPGHAAPRLIRSPQDLKANMKHPSDELYHVREDHGQQYDAAAERPDIVKRLKISIGDMFTKLNAPSEQLDRLGLHEVGYEG